MFWQAEKYNRSVRDLLLGGMNALTNMEFVLLMHYRTATARLRQQAGGE